MGSLYVAGTLVSHPTVTLALSLLAELHCVQQHLAGGRLRPWEWVMPVLGLGVAMSPTSAQWNARESLWGGASLLGNIFLSDSQNSCARRSFSFLGVDTGCCVLSKTWGLFFSLWPHLLCWSPLSHSSNHWPPAFLEQTNPISASGTLHSLFPSRVLFLQIFTGSLFISFGVWLRCQFLRSSLAIIKKYLYPSSLYPYSPLFYSPQNIPLTHYVSLKFILLSVSLFPIRMESRAGVSVSLIHCCVPNTKKNTQYVVALLNICWMNEWTDAI